MKIVFARQSFNDVPMRNKVAIAVTKTPGLNERKDVVMCTSLKLLKQRRIRRQ